MEAVEKAGVKKYSKFPYLHGVGGHSEPHLDTHVWPGSNSALFVGIDEITLSKLTPILSKLKNEYMEDGLKVFSFPVEEVI
jgi:hypothetical protein